MIGKAPEISFTSESDEVLYSDHPITCVDHSFLKLLKLRAAANPRKRIRLCSHPSPEDRLHEMLIVHHREAYVPPHIHRNKSESYHLIEGSLDIVLFDDEGTPQTHIPLTAQPPGFFYYRLSDERFHTVLPTSEWVVFHETTNGPFRREECQNASWAPALDAGEAVQQAYIKMLRKEIEQTHESR
jgi:cupin fold WbuC family metalloprotein